MEEKMDHNLFAELDKAAQLEARETNVKAHKTLYGRCRDFLIRLNEENVDLKIKISELGGTTSETVADAAELEKERRAFLKSYVLRCMNLQPEMQAEFAIETWNLINKKEETS
jgi:hypothetical protein